MVKLSIVLTYILNIFPAYSIIYSAVKIFIASHFISLIFFPILLLKRNYSLFIVKKYIIPIQLMLLLFIIYTIVAILDNRNIMIYTGYIIAFLYILMSYYFIEIYPNIYIRFVKIFLILNALYAFFQLIMLNLDINSISMIHSNLPAQIHYAIPIFIQEPFYRYSGLFNESAPFAFYLAISFSLFHSLGSKYIGYKNVAFLLLLFSGSKAAYLFLLLHFAFFSKNKFIKLFFFILTISSIILFFYYYQILADLSLGQIASVNSRYQDLLSSDNPISFFGTDLGKSSDGEIELNFFNIFIAGFGLFGITLIILLYVFFYISLKIKDKKYFLIPLFIGLLSSGSLLIVQYSFLLSSLFLLSKLKRNQE